MFKTEITSTVSLPDLTVEIAPTLSNTIAINTGQAAERDHNQLRNLDYESSGHTGFASQVNLDAVSDAVAALQLQVNGLIVYTNHYEFPSSGDSTRLYIAVDEDVIYRWSGSAYVALTGIDVLQKQIAAIYGGDSNE